MARSLGVQKSVQNELMDVEIDAKIIADGNSSTAEQGAHTEFQVPQWYAPGYGFDGSGKITQFDGKFTWKGTITIQTIYGGGASPSDVSCYGRGTTADDVRNRDITLGFHENCHRLDFESFLKSNPLPDPPDIRVGMAKRAFADEMERFKRELDDYRKSMDQDSARNTDEVGHAKSVWKRTGRCFVHQLP
jgi:hypothetical protein